MIKIPRNKHRGQRCFVIASGPSVRRMDLSVLKDEITICVNESYKALDFDPTYICIGDYKLWPYVKEAYAKKQHTSIICGSGTKGSCGSDYEGDNLDVLIPLGKETIMDSGFNWNLEEPLRKGFNVITEIVLPFVCWAGFDDCFLVGCDCNENGYAFDDPVRGVEEQKIDERVFKTYDVITKTRKLPTRIWNATLGGRLKSFVRRNFKELFEGGLNPDDFLVVGYYTPDRNYQELAERMRDSVLMQGLQCEIVQMESRAAALLRNIDEIQKPMPWVLNCSICSSFILEMMRKYPTKNLLYLDADAVMVRYPSLFFDKPVDYDFAAPFLNNQFVEDELQSNTLFFKASSGAKKLARAWRREQDKRNMNLINGRYQAPFVEAWDQKVLRAALDKLENISWIRLPWEYGKITLTPKGQELMEGVLPEDVVIWQHQASRQNKRKV